MSTRRRPSGRLLWVWAVRGCGVNPTRGREDKDLVRHEEGGQGRTKAARRGSLGGPVSGYRTWSRKPARASWSPRAVVRLTLAVTLARAVDLLWRGQDALGLSSSSWRSEGRQTRISGASHPSAGRRRTLGGAAATGRAQSSRRPRRMGVMTSHEYAHRPCPELGSRLALGQAADLAVAQAVVDEGEDGSGYRHPGHRPLLVAPS